MEKIIIIEKLEVKLNELTQEKQTVKIKKEIEKIQAMIKLTKLAYQKTIIASVPSVSSSGYNRIIKFAAIDNDNLLNLTYLISEAGQHKYNDEYNGISRSGCGEDMVFNTLNGINQEIGYLIGGKDYYNLVLKESYSML